MTPEHWLAQDEALCLDDLVDSGQRAAVLRYAADAGATLIDDESEESD